MKKLVLLLSVLLLSTLHAHEAFSIDLNLGGKINKPVKNLREIKTQHVVRQTMDYSCGPAAMATLLSFYFNDTITEEEVIKSLLLTTDLKKVKAKKGFSLLDLKNFAKLKGYEVTGYRMDLEYLLALDTPVLIPISIKDYSHFVIFRGMLGDRVFIADPALGKMTMKIERFMRLWEGGIGLVVTKSDAKEFNPPLRLTEEEKAVFADPALVRQVFGINMIGNVYGDGEF
ncbi:C39 family peptidase [Candidatus Omnitrophota bacterium]